MFTELELAVLIYIAVISLISVIVCIYDKLISKLDRDELLDALAKFYFTDIIVKK